MAEVLITLGIVGVVAALTIPNLIHKFKKIIIETKVKQTYSKLQNIYNTAVTDTGLTAEDWLPSDMTTLTPNERRDYIYNNYIKPYMKTTGWNKATGVFYDESGIQYAISWDVTGKTIYRPFIGRITFNVTGGKSNIVGRDVFHMLYQYEDKPYGWWFSALRKDAPLAFVACGDARNNFTQYKNSAYKTRTWPGCHNENAQCCGDIIMRNGWKIPDDYPIKID